MLLRPTKVTTSLAVCVVIGLAGTQAPAQSLAPFGTTTFATSSNASSGSVTCTDAFTSTPSSNAPFSGGSAGGATSVSGSSTSNGDASDKTVVATSLQGQGSITTRGADPWVIRVGTSGSVAATTTKAQAQCVVTAASSVALTSSFTLTQPGILTVVTKASDYAFAGFDVTGSGGSTSMQVSGGGSDFSGTQRQRLAAGTYDTLLRSNAYLKTARTVPSQAVATTVEATFNPFGALLEADRPNKALKFVTMPTQHDCGGDALRVTVTGKRKAAKKVKTVLLSIDYGTRSETVLVKTPKPGRVISIRAAGLGVTTLDVTVTQKSTKKGKPGLQSLTSATYESCS